MAGLISGQKRKLGKYSSKHGNFHGRDAPFDVVPQVGIELVIAGERCPLPRFNGLSLVSRRSGDERLPHLTTIANLAALGCQLLRSSRAKQRLRADGGL